MTNKYIPIIGLEVHIELATKSKMFCGCPADHFGKEPNTMTCPVCLGLPGALPVPNKKAVEWTILLGLALGCTINELSKFDRKHYFYPDLPKGYQISQYDQPFARDGELKLKVKSEKLKVDDEKTIRIRRVHLEEDTGKLQHAIVDGPTTSGEAGLRGASKNVSLVDFNRSGVPLVEIVTEPDFRTIEEVDAFVRKIQQIVRYLGISGADMEKGSMRIEPSISIRSVKRSRKAGSSVTKDELPNYRVEIKNINSFKFARNAIEYEIERQTDMLQNRVEPLQQTRGFVEAKGITVAQREKEEAHDYRYFPEPDIPPLRFSEVEISNLKSQIPELPEAKRDRFIKGYGLSEYDVTQLIETRERAEYFEEAVSCQLSAVSYKDITPKTIANWIINKKINIAEISPEELLKQIAVSTQTSQMSDEELEKIIKQVLLENSKAVEDYKKGNTKVLGFFIGLVARYSKSKVEPTTITKIIQKLLT